jgi:hypothetical protein
VLRVRAQPEIVIAVASCRLVASNVDVAVERAVEPEAAVDLPCDLGGGVLRGAVVGVGGAVVRRRGRSLLEVPDRFVAGVPDLGGVRGRSSDGGVAVVEVEDGAVVDRGDLHPGDELAGRGAVALDLVVELGAAAARPVSAG